MRVYKSHHEDVKIPELDLTTFLFDSEWCAAKEDTKIHIEAANPQNSITKAEARDAIQRISYVLRNKFGIGASKDGHDVVLSTSPGNPFMPILFYSIVAAGGVYSGASTEATVQDYVRQIEDADAKLILCSAELEERIVEASRQCNISLNRILIIDAKTPGDWKLISSSDRSDVLNLRDGPKHDWRRISTQRELETTTTCLLYSSGTTGLPKGVRISHWNLIACNVCGMEVTKKYRAQREAEGNPFTFSTIAHLPMAHIGGITWSSLIPFYLGGTSYWVEKYDFDSFIEYHRRYRLTVQWTVPPIWLAIAKSPKVTDHFDSLEIAGTGAAPMGSELARQAASKLGRGRIPTIGQLWGATETTGSITAIDWDSVDETDSHGAPFANIRFRFVDEDGKDVEPGQPGEVLVSGPFVCQGYHNRPEADQSSFIDGFYRTGDVGIWENGLIYIVDRLKELIKYKGLQVAPAELEALLVTHPKINDAAVIGVQDMSRATEVPRAFVVPKPGISVDAKEIMDFVRENVAPYKQLRGGVVFVDEIPKSASGKILRKILRERVALEENIKAKL